ncbi:MAG: tetratricopeptide repeat protein [Candidatus Omnitrophota bacterium]
MKKFCFFIVLIIIISGLSSYCIAVDGEYEDDALSEEEMEYVDELDEAEALSEEYNQEGLELAKKGENEKAIESFKKAIETDELNLEAYQNLGYVYAWGKDYDKAIEIFERLSGLVPESSTPYRQLISIYSLQGLNDKVISCGEKALEINSNDYTVMANLVNPYIVVGRYTDAIDFIDKLIERNPNRPRLYRLLAMAYIGMGDEKRAKKEFTKSYNMIKDMTLYEDAPEKTKSIDELFNGMKGDFYFEKGNRLLDEAKNDEAIEYYKKSIKLNADNHKPYYILAKIYNYRGEKEESLNYLKKAVGLNPLLLEELKDSSDFETLKDMEGYNALFAD